MGEPIKMFQTLDNNSIISLIIPKGERTCHMFWKNACLCLCLCLCLSYCDKCYVSACFKGNFYIMAKWKTVKNFQAA